MILFDRIRGYFSRKKEEEREQVVEEMRGEREQVVEERREVEEPIDDYIRRRVVLSDWVREDLKRRLTEERIDFENPEKYGLPDTDTLLRLRYEQGYVSSSNPRKNQSHWRRVTVHYYLERISIKQRAEREEWEREYERKCKEAFEQGVQDAREVFAPIKQSSQPDLKISYED